MSLEDLVLAAAQDPNARDGVQRWYDPKLWSTDLARIQLPKSGFLDFETRPFLIEPFRDTHPELVFLKGAQLGFSTLAICRTLWAATTFPMSIIYTFPTRDDVTEFTAARINPIVLSSEYLSSRILDVNSVKMKQFSQMSREAYRKMARGGVRMDEVRLSTVYFNGAAKPEDATTVDADLLVHDEEDRSNPQVIEQYESRLDASAYKWKIRLSTPTIPGAGIDRPWRLSDQRAWMVKCPGCNAEFAMGFPENIEPDTYEEVEELQVRARYKCHKCGRTLSDGERSHGRWVAAKPDLGRPHGYHLSQMSAPWISAERILYRKMKATWEADFWNLVMGLPWEGGSNVMTAEAVRSRMVGGPMWSSGSGCTMGVDVGRMLDVVIGHQDQNGPRTVYVGRLNDFAQLDELMTRFGVACCVIDAMPETRKVLEFVERWPGRVWRANYSDPSKGMPRDTRWDEERRVVTIGRTDALDASSTELLSTRLLPGFDGSDALVAYVEHHVNSKRVPIFVPGMEMERIVQQYRWVEVGPDHLFHAATYEWMARQSFQPSANLPSRAIYGLNRSVKWSKQVRDGYDPRRLDRTG